MISVHLINTNDPLYQSERQLRNRILLQPVGLPDHAWEMHDKKSWHFIAVEKGRVIGCIVLVPLDKEGKKTQLMQMAVESNQQGKGIGKLLVNELLDFCQSKGITEVTCHARETAVQFYLNLGFVIYDESFEEVGIPHQHMKIDLSERTNRHYFQKYSRLT
ncbi:GNAT family N-acetyltransferase [Adhaeribacter radiodurans]|uniref:GNAT family N-acetyltransferase n=1 Tax=Adhaeribacter radiodurans TaxID=2745197 RepID=A0A7L7LCP8_9BACT|nr:GNAT family N-acetyltransferase [Adhaeribacter radiodurans]QMU30622.1 GNAT family N-acetyltransferase [Adhaeribacter radiodurans]